MNFKFNDADMVQVKEMYLPYLGKCSVMTPTLFDVEDGEKQWFCADVLNKHRKESVDSENKKEARFDLVDLNGYIDFGRKKIEGKFKKAWIGGLVEEYNFSHPFKFANVEKNIESNDYKIYSVDIVAELGN